MLRAKKHKLVVALTLLIISAVLMSTASYAWFAMNTRATADNFEVEAYSDSLYLEISKDNTTFNQSVEYGESDRKDLRLVTYKTIDSGDLVYKAPTFTIVNTGNFEGLGEYYAKADSDATMTSTSNGSSNNYIRVSLSTGSSLKDLYDDIEFDILTSGVGDGTSKYYQRESNGNDYNVTIPTSNDSLKGLYAMYQPITGNYEEDGVYYTKASSGHFEVVADFTPETEIASGTYVRVTDGMPTALTTGTYASANTGTTYWKKDASGNFSVEEHLSLGDSLVGYYTVTLPSGGAEAIATATFDGTSVYYVKSGNDYVCLGVPAQGTPINGYLYWGRAYSTELDQVQSNNTLNVLSTVEAETNYYLHKTLYLRQGVNTNHATNLRVSDIEVTGAASSLKAALRVLIIATSTSGETATVTYDAGTDAITHVGRTTQNNMFDMLLGDGQETVTVEVYIYFDGTDEVAKNSSIAVLNGQIVSIEFAIDELTYNQVAQ